MQAFIIALYDKDVRVSPDPLRPNELPAPPDPARAWPQTSLGHSARLWSGSSLIEMLIGYAFVVAGLIRIARGWRAVSQARGRLITGRL